MARADFVLHGADKPPCSRWAGRPICRGQRGRRLSDGSRTEVSNVYRHIRRCLTTLRNRYEFPPVLNLDLLTGEIATGQSGLIAVDNHGVVFEDIAQIALLIEPRIPGPVDG